MAAFCRAIAACSSSFLRTCAFARGALPPIFHGAFEFTKREARCHSDDYFTYLVYAEDARASYSRFQYFR